MWSPTLISPLTWRILVSLNITRTYWRTSKKLIRSDQSLSRVRLFMTPWISAHQASLSITNSRSSLRLTSIESLMPFSHLILCHPLLLLSTIHPSIRVFSSESTLPMSWPKYWSFSFSIIPSKEIPGLISFRMDWLDLLAVPGTLRSLLKCHSSKASILRRSAFFTVQLSHPYMTTGKTIALTRQTFVGKALIVTVKSYQSEHFDPGRLALYHMLGKSSQHFCSWLAAAAAKALQSCLTLCDPRDSSPPGSPVPIRLQHESCQKMRWNSFNNHDFGFQMINFFSFFSK